MNLDIRIREKDMYPHIAKFMPNLVYYYHQALRDESTIRTATEVRAKLGHNFPEHDVLTAFTTEGGINRIYSVEAKLNVDTSVFFQADKRSKYCDYCYVAIPLDRDAYVFFESLIQRFTNMAYHERKELKTGLMIVDLDSGNVGVIRRAKLNAGLNKEYKDKLFRIIYKKAHKRIYLEKNPVVKSEQITLGEQENE